jgi:UDP-N-acetylmuramoyl-tripeptide--D-alanyl-D-alanine ligase
MITLDLIVQAFTGIQIAQTGPMLTEAVIDSRVVIPGALFIALPGEKSDGHRFVGAAFEKGAQVALVQQDMPEGMRVLDLRRVNSSSEELSIPEMPFCLRVDDTLQALQDLARFWRRKLSLRVVGITGSVGKSSTKELTAEVLARKFHTYRNPGNYNNEIGLPLTILNLGSGYERLVAEMGFYYPGEITFLCDIAQPEIGVVTNIGTVHAERAGSQEAIAKGKSELVQALPAAPEGTAILNYDDPYVRAMADQTKANVLFYGLDAAADLWADEIQGCGLKGIQFRMHYQGKSVRMEVPILGRHSVQTILRAAAVGFCEGLTWQEVTDGLVHSNTQLRLVAVQTNSGALILDDTYNATPESTLAALDLLDELQGQKIAVLGDMLELGQYEKEGHELVGQRAAQVVQHLIAVGPRGRTIADSAKEVGLPSTAITWVEDALQAADVLKYNLQSGDVVLIKGSHGLRMDRIAAILEENA